MVDYYAAVSRNIFDAAADAIDIFFIGNDFGSQRGPLLSEAMFRRFILPHLERLVDLGHAYGLKVMLHCCGGFAELIPAMIEIGLDGLHALQPCCRGMDPARLKAEFGDRILLQRGDRLAPRADRGHARARSARTTREMLEIMMPGGGYVAGASHDTILEETPVENVAGHVRCDSGIRNVSVKEWRGTRGDGRGRENCIRRAISPSSIVPRPSPLVSRSNLMTKPMTSKERLLCAWTARSPTGCPSRCTSGSRTTWRSTWAASARWRRSSGSAWTRRSSTSSRWASSGWSRPTSPSSPRPSGATRPRSSATTRTTASSTTRSTRPRER